MESTWGDSRGRGTRTSSRSHDSCHSNTEPRNHHWGSIPNNSEGANASADSPVWISVANKVGPCTSVTQPCRSSKIIFEPRDLMLLANQDSNFLFRMSAIGSLVFCTDCGNLLDSSTGDEKTILVCNCCGAQNRGMYKSAYFGMSHWRNNTDTSSKTVITRSKPSAFPSLLRQKRSAVQTVEASDRQAEAIIQEKCPMCGRDEMRYYTLQLRSADEGSTVFYTCDCGHK